MIAKYGIPNDAGTGQAKRFDFFAVGISKCFGEPVQVSP
jgi:hypothetical protein